MGVGLNMTANPARMVLCWNHGSSSVKFAVYEIGDEERRSITGGVRFRTPGQSELWLEDAGVAASLHVGDENPAKLACDAIERGLLPRPEIIGHRIVHGGPYLTAHCRLDDGKITVLRDAVPYAPLHLPEQIQAIEVFLEQLPKIHQVACFDTVFHRSMPDIARMFPLPLEYGNHGVVRYGFHGLSYEYVTGALEDTLGAKAVIAHLGAGASMVALRNGRPVDTTMGLTPTGGLMMGTRSGDLDPGLLIYLLRQHGFSPDRIERLVNHEAGLLGVSGVTADMKTLLEDGSANAVLAVDMFCHHARKHIAALSATLGGLETLVFTGGIGERSAVVRDKICRGLAFLGIKLDHSRNCRNESSVGISGAPCAVRVIETNEELIIARHAVNFAERR